MARVGMPAPPTPHGPPPERTRGDHALSQSPKQTVTLWSAVEPGARQEADIDPIGTAIAPEERRQNVVNIPSTRADEPAAGWSRQGVTRLSREQILDRILDLSRGTTTAFLADFDRATLADYLDRLTRLRDHRGTTSRWVRRPGPPAITQTRWMTAQHA